MRKIVVWISRPAELCIAQKPAALFADRLTFWLKSSWLLGDLSISYMLVPFWFLIFARCMPTEDFRASEAASVMSCLISYRKKEKERLWTKMERKLCSVSSLNLAAKLVNKVSKWHLISLRFYCKSHFLPTNQVFVMLQSADS